MYSLILPIARPAVLSAGGKISPAYEPLCRLLAYNSTRRDTLIVVKWCVTRTHKYSVFITRMCVCIHLHPNRKREKKKKSTVQVCASFAFNQNYSQALLTCIVAGTTSQPSSSWARLIAPGILQVFCYSSQLNTGISQ